MCVLRSVDFAHAGWAGDIDLSEIVANDIEAYKKQSPLAKRRAYLFGNPAIAI